MPLTGSSRRVAALLTATALTASLTAAAHVTHAAPTAGAATTSDTTPIYLQTRYPFAERAADLVSRMTLPEKVAQLHTNSAPAIPRLGVRKRDFAKLTAPAGLPSPIYRRSACGWRRHKRRRSG